MKRDYSEYKPSEHEIRHLKLSSNKYIKYDYFVNKVRFDTEEKFFKIFVDATKEDYFMEDFIHEHDKLHNIARNYSEAGLKEMEENRKEAIAYNKKIFKKFKKKYDIDLEPRKYHFHHYEKDGEYPIPINNALCACGITLNCGEGILDFIYADFEAEYKEHFAHAYIGEQLKLMGEQKRREQGIIDSEDEEPQKILAKVDEIVELYNRYELTTISIKDLCYVSLYSAICPPVFMIEREDYTAIRHYYRYLIALQKDYLDLIEFCYDEDFYPEALGELYPHERFTLYLLIHDLHSSFDRKEVFAPDTQYISGLEMPYGLEKGEIVKRINKYFNKKDEFYELAKEYDVDPKRLHYAAVMPKFIKTVYEINSIKDILELEFTKMLEMDIRFKKCKRCGKYFLVKGNYPTLYCDRIAEGETKSCKKLGPIESYKEKNADNEAKKIYSKYYKRYHARITTRQIKEKNFKQWQYKAITMRDECIEGKITIQEYIDWNEAAFPNRTKKS